MLHLISATVHGQDEGHLKPLQLPPAQQNESIAAPASHGDANTVNIPEPAVPESTHDAVEPSPVGFAIALAADFGLGLHESADVRNSFDGAGLIGLQTQLRFIQIKTFRLGLNLGFAHFAHNTSKGTNAFTMSSRMNRLTSLASVELFKKAFFVNGQVGAGFMLLSAESTLIQNGVSHTSSNTGFDPGFMTAIDVGIELGQYFFKWKREARLAFHSDWVRHHERDEIVLAIQISVGLYSSFSK